MIELTFTEDAVDQLRELALRHPHPGVRLKGMAVLLKSQGLKTPLIITTLGVCDNTVRNYLHAYDDGGPGKLAEIGFYRPQSELQSFASDIHDYCYVAGPSS